MCASPQLFAACRVLLRLRKPRHPPCALDYFLRGSLARLSPPIKAFFMCSRFIFGFRLLVFIYYIFTRFPLLFKSINSLGVSINVSHPTALFSLVL